MTVSFLTLAAAAPQQLPGVLHSLQSPLDHYGYLAVAGFVFLEDFGVPVPGEAILVVGAAYAGTGRLSIWLVGLLGFIAATLGDNVGYVIGHFGGRPLVERWGRYILLTPQRLDTATRFFERHGGKIVVVARFIEGLRQANGIIAGITRMHWARFVLFNAIGAALWVGVWTSVGYFSGSHLKTIYDDVTRYDVYFVIAVGVLVLAAITRHVVRRRREPQAGEPAPSPEGG